MASGGTGIVCRLVVPRVVALPFFFVWSSTGLVRSGPVWSGLVWSGLACSGVVWSVTTRRASDHSALRAEEGRLGGFIYPFVALPYLALSCATGCCCCFFCRRVLALTRYMVAFLLEGLVAFFDRHVRAPPPRAPSTPPCLSLCNNFRFRFGGVCMRV